MLRKARQQQVAIAKCNRRASQPQPQPEAVQASETSKGKYKYKAQAQGTPHSVCLSVCRCAFRTGSGSAQQIRGKEMRLAINGGAACNCPHSSLCLCVSECCAVPGSRSSQAQAIRKAELVAGVQRMELAWMELGSAERRRLAGRLRTGADDLYGAPPVLAVASVMVCASASGRRA